MNTFIISSFIALNIYYVLCIYDIIKRFGYNKYDYLFKIIYFILYVYSFIEIVNINNLYYTSIAIIIYGLIMYIIIDKKGNFSKKYMYGITQKNDKPYENFINKNISKYKKLGDLTFYFKNDELLNYGTIDYVNFKDDYDFKDMIIIPNYDPKMNEYIQNNISSVKDLYKLINILDKEILKQIENKNKKFEKYNNGGLELQWSTLTYNNKNGIVIISVDYNIINDLIYYIDELNNQNMNFIN